MKKINYCLFAYLLVGFSYLTFGQSEKTEANQTHLQTYISEGLAQNESIKEQQFCLRKKSFGSAGSQIAFLSECRF